MLVHALQHQVGVPKVLQLRMQLLRVPYSPSCRSSSSALHTFLVFSTLLPCMLCMHDIVDFTSLNFVRQGAHLGCCTASQQHLEEV